MGLSGLCGKTESQLQWVLAGRQGWPQGSLDFGLLPIFLWCSNSLTLLGSLLIPTPLPHSSFKIPSHFLTSPSRAKLTLQSFQLQELSLSKMFLPPLTSIWLCLWQAAVVQLVENTLLNCFLWLTVQSTERQSTFCPLVNTVYNYHSFKSVLSFRHY